MGRVIAADVLITVTGYVDYIDTVKLGQSFTATKTGVLTKIEVVNAGFGGSTTLRIYQGAGTGGTVLYTKAGIDFGGVNNVTDYTTYTYFPVTIDSTVNLTSGQVYTFEFDGSFELVFSDDITTNYSDGQAYISGNGWSWADMLFRVTQSDAVSAPGAPTGVTATASDGQASLTFNAPASDGGAAITQYTATANPGGASGSCAGPAACGITVTGLSNGTAYTFTVTAANSAGTSSASSASNSVTPKANQTITFTNPGAQNFGTTPTLSATATSGLAVSFSSSTTGVCTITSGGALTFLTAGTCTTDADQAGNVVYNAASQVSRSFTVNAVVPGAPAMGTATAGDTQASVTFSAPASNGGATVTGYTVTSNPGGITETGSTSPIVVGGLTNGVAYTFTVTAANSAGTGSASAASNSVTPAASQTITFANPGAQNFGTTPTLSATSTSGLTVTFSSSTTGVCTITSGGALTFVTTGTCTIDADQTGDASFAPALQVSRSFTVNAVVPAAPIIGNATAGSTQASIDFTAPAFTGGASITGYTVTASPGGATSTGSASPIAVTGLTNGVAYTFTVTATNSAGTGSASAASNSVTPAASQTITFANPGSQTFGTTPTLPAASTSGLPVAFSSSTTGVCTITSGGVLTFVTAGTCTINADQAGNASFTAAAQVSRSFAVTAVAPGAPAIAAVAAGDGSATIAFKPPASNGGGAITSYRVTATPGGAFAVGVGSPIAVTGLINGTTYTFTVTATNSAGTGSPSAASGPVVPTTPSSGSSSTSTPSSGAGPDCTVWLSRGDAPVPAAGGLGVLTVHTEAGCQWRVSSSAPWLLVAPAEGIGQTALSYVAHQNTSADVREGVFTAASGAASFALRVTQQGRGGFQGAPLALTATVDRRTVRLAWQTLAGVLDHVVEVGSQPGQRDLGTYHTGPATTASVSGVADGTYYMRVRAVGPAGPSDSSNELAVVVRDLIPGAPGAPGDLVPLPLDTAGRIGVRWSPASGDVARYIVEFGTQPGQSDLTRVETDATTLQWDTALEPPADYYVRVRAVNGIGTSAPSNEVTMSRAGRGAGPVGQPQAVTAGYDGRAIHVAWAPPLGAANVTAYVVEVGTLPGTANLVQTMTAATSWSQVVPEGSRYYVRVRALDHAGVGPASSDVVVVTGTEVTQLPGAPEGLTAAVAGGRLTLQWLAPANGGNVDEYVIEAGTSAGASDAAVVPTGNASPAWFYDGVPADRAFYIRVRAKNAVGLGPASAEVRIGPQ